MKRERKRERLTNNSDRRRNISETCGAILALGIVLVEFHGFAFNLLAFRKIDVGNNKGDSRITKGAGRVPQIPMEEIVFHFSAAMQWKNLSQRAKRLASN